MPVPVWPRRASCILYLVAPWSKEFNFLTIRGPVRGLPEAIKSVQKRTPAIDRVACETKPHDSSDTRDVSDSEQSSGTAQEHIYHPTEHIDHPTEEEHFNQTEHSSKHSSSPGKIEVVAQQSTPADNRLASGPAPSESGNQHFFTQTNHISMNSQSYGNIDLEVSKIIGNVQTDPIFPAFECEPSQGRMNKLILIDIH